MKVLYATEGREPAIHAGRLIERVGDPAKIEITAITVSSFDMAAEEGSARYGHYSPTAAHERAIEIVDDAVEGLRRGEFKATGIVAAGDPAFEIVTTIEREGFDLSVVGGGSGTWLDQVLLGSTSTNLLHSSPSSVIVVNRAPAGDGPTSIVVGADGSRGAEFALRTLAGFADPERCAVTVVAVSDRRSALLGRSSVREGADVDGEIEGRAERNAAHAAEVLGAAGFTVTTAIRRGNPAEQLLEAGKDCDLAVVGSRGLGSIKRGLLGSVSDKVARHSRATLVGRRL